MLGRHWLRIFVCTLLIYFCNVRFRVLISIFKFFKIYFTFPFFNNNETKLWRNHETSAQNSGDY